EVLRAWNFPRQIIDPIAAHQSPVGLLREGVPKQLVETMRLMLANRLAHAMFRGASGNSHVSAITDLCDALKVPDQAILKIIETAGDQTRDLTLAMLSAASTSVDFTTAADRVRPEFGGPFRPL